MVPLAACIIAHALYLIKRPAHEDEIIAMCSRMRELGYHDFKLGVPNNLRNRIQRNWGESKIYKDTWGPKGYAAIFVASGTDNHRLWSLVKGYKPPRIQDIIPDDDPELGFG